MERANHRFGQGVFVREWKVTPVFFIGILVLAMARTSHALVITSPMDGQAYKEGDTVKVVTELSPDDPDIFYVGFSTTGALDDCDEITTHPRYECSFVIPPASPSIIVIRASEYQRKYQVFGVVYVKDKEGEHAQNHYKSFLRNMGSDGMGW